MAALTTDHTDCGSGRVELAANWYREHLRECPRPIVGHLVRTFGLAGPREALEALKLATSGGANVAAS